MIGIMKLSWLAIGLVPALSASLLWTPNPALGAQSDTAHGHLTRVNSPSADPVDDSQRFDRDAWRRRLTQSDLDARQREFEALADRARRDKSVREIVDGWAHDTSNADLAWTSRLLLREIDSQPPKFGGQGFGGTPGFGGMHDWSDLQSRFDQLERQFGGMDSTFGDLQQELERLRREPLLPPNSGPNAAGGTTGKSSSQSFTLQVGPDGVTCRIQEDVDGKKQTKEYKAESLEALLDAHPELRDRIQAGHGRFGWTGPLFSDGSESPGELRRLARPFSGAPPTDIFGVEFSKLAPEKLKELNLEPERGLHVERTVPGTIAQVLGVKRGDLLIEMNGIPLYAGEDVSRALRERAPDGELVVTLIDGKGQRRTLTWKPSTEPEQDKSAPPSGSTSKDEARKG
jgi:hypothetical protein